jgi:hypothetical protein
MLREGAVRQAAFHALEKNRHSKVVPIKKAEAQTRPTDGLNLTSDTCDRDYTRIIIRVWFRRGLGLAIVSAANC